MVISPRNGRASKCLRLVNIVQKKITSQRYGVGSPVLEWVLGKTMKMIGAGEASLLRELELFSLEKRRLRVEPCSILSLLLGDFGERQGQTLY